MDNPWAATTWDANTSLEWPITQRTDQWLHGDTQWEPSATHDQQDSTSVSDSGHQSARPTSPAQDASDPISPNISGQEVLQDPPDDDWDMTWSTAPSHSKDTQPPDQWEAARQEKEKLNRTVPPESLDSLLRLCHQVSQDIWPAPETSKEEDWKTGFGEHADVIALLAQLLPTDSTLPPTVQFSTTATAKAMNEALKLTRHSPVAASSPISRLLASKGSLEWEKSVKAKQHVVPDTAHVGWRVIEKEDRLSTLEESKPRKVTGGLLSFWNRRASTIQTAPVETPRERSTSPARSSLESVKSTPHPPSSRAASPPKASTTPIPPPPPPPPPTDPHTMVATAPAPSAVSRFLNRFSRIRGVQHSALALSPDDLEFLSDIVPSSSDPPDEGINDSTLDALTGANNSSLPPKLPPPPKQPTLSSRPSSVLGLGPPDGTILQVYATNHTTNVPALAPPLSPEPAVSFSRTQSPRLDGAALTVAPAPSIQKTLQSSSQPSSWSQSSFTLPPPQKTTPLLSIPPLLPPPPVSPPQTPRPSAFTSKTPGDSSTTPNTSFHDSDDEFSAFTSFPPPAPAPFPLSGPYLSQGPPSPPSPPPRRSYERTHYPSSSYASSIISPASQSSLDRLYSSRSSISASLDSFDDFVSPLPVVRGDGRKRTPSPPPLPVKSQLQHPQLLRLDTSSPRVYRAHTPSQMAFASPTVHTSLMQSAFSSPSVSDAEHQRTQGLVNQAAARGGVLWPNSPDTAEPMVKAIPPPPRSTSTSPKSFIGQDGFDLLGDTLGDGLGSLVRMGSKASAPPATDVSRAPFGAASGPGKGPGFGSQLRPSLPPLSSASAPILSLSSLGTPAAMGTSQSGLKQTGGLSAQDLSFFEGL